MPRPESLAAGLTQAWTGCVAQRLQRQMGQDILPQDFVQVDLMVLVDEVLVFFDVVRQWRR